jgi:uncharacterized protein
MAESELISNELSTWFSELQSCVVAFSGGVDSGVVAAAAFRSLDDRAVAITGVGPAVSQFDIDAARTTAASIGIRHVLLPTHEIEDPAYQVNDGRRCYHCKSNLYAALKSWASENGFQTILSGANADDLGDYRPGLEAASENDVRSPLAELKIGKEQVRELARLWSLPIADRPASPCLASRIAYGEAVTRERLTQVEFAELWLSEHGFADVRVRLHSGGLARIEVSLDDLTRFTDGAFRRAMTDYFQQLGFNFVTLDLTGRRTGSMNLLLPIIEP